ncbi:hypothetical protein FHG87_014681 [Trinorchestia longiramus]|nr:hypothetical protein FHG87_014681 [Trinorchestia longiramus]
MLRDEKQRRWCVAATWLAYVGYASAVAVAEILFSANFLHQVIISVVIGLAIGRRALHNNFSQVDSAKKIIFVNAVILVVINLVLWQRDAVGSFNEYQKLAFKWCQRREWMQIDPVPLLDVFLYTGYAVGAGFCTKSAYFKRLNKPKFTLKMLVSLVVLNLASSILLSMTFDAIPRSFVLPYVYAWYVAQMVGGALMPYVCGAAVPYFVQKVSGVSPAKLKKGKQQLYIYAKKMSLFSSIASEVLFSHYDKEALDLTSSIYRLVEKHGPASMRNRTSPNLTPKLYLLLAPGDQ